MQVSTAACGAIFTVYPASGDATLKVDPDGAAVHNFGEILTSLAGATEVLSGRGT